ncbi:MAG: PCRF domain-containing protein [Candidatus Pacebacteria bacterium]|nr:PCRF domain-containing protein [Candidatus Paceibacterota bacterium]
MPEEPESIIIEIRAGVGGDESALFVADLFKMYLKYAEKKSWKTKVLESSPTDIKGFKEIIFEIKSQDAWKELQYEGGVHRVQRVPDTEKSGRIHTSTVTVAVLPKAKTAEINIRPDTLKVDFFRSSGPGGQNVNKRETAVRITHIPTGIVSASQTERNQLLNKENAMAILEAKILEKQQEESIEDLGDKRKTQVKWAKRAEKMRTYNFPQDRLTDHRINKKWHNLENILDGNLEKIIKSFQKTL